MISSSSSFLSFFFFLLLSGSAAADSSIVFATLGRSRYAFDIFSVHTTTAGGELRLTDGVSVNYNGFFPSEDSSSLLYVSERNGSSAILLDFIPSLSPASSSSSSRRSALHLPSQLHLTIPLPPSMKDRPSIATVGDHHRLIYVSTHEPSPSPRQSWAAVYSTDLLSGATRRLSPPDVADFSPAVSPSALWTAVASSGLAGWAGEVQELNTDIFIFLTDDGSSRTKLISHGGWPCWADDHTVYFHRRSSDGWWSVYRAVVQFDGFGPFASSVERITSPDFHAFTPAASPGSPGVIAVATRRPESSFRHIELVDFSGEVVVYREVTRPITPNSHHFNPFISPDGQRVGYHRCRGRKENRDPPLLLENIVSPSPESFSLFRIDGNFPSFSPAGDRIAYVGSSGLAVVNSNGSGGPLTILAGAAFSTAWDRKREGVVYTSGGPSFAPVTTEVDIFSVTVDENLSEISVKKLTVDGKNNAFPSPSPDGKWVVFRSGRSGYKNLYITDAEKGETAELHQLTGGLWTDTMCNWSPDGEWIAFASDRHNPGGGGFAIYVIHPNGTGLRKVVQSGEAGRTNHPWFSPDSKKLVFTTDFAGVSAEPVANPHHYQPYGDIFTVNLDGSGIRRLTHNPYEDGTPTWGPKFLKPTDVAENLVDGGGPCRFDDCHWLSSERSTMNEASC